MLGSWSRLLVAFAFAPASLLCGVAQASADEPQERVLEIYRILEAGEDDPAQVNLVPRSLVETWFTSDFIEALEADIACWEAGSEGMGSPWFEGQDFHITRLRVTQIMRNETNAEILAEFRNFDVETEAIFIFERHDGAWLIADVDDIKSLMLENAEICR